jgi:hypothetical protein
MDPRETAWSVMDWFHLAQEMNQRRVIVNTVMYLRVPKMFGKRINVFYSTFLSRITCMF